MIGLQVFYEGHVQGVGFRYTCKRLARGYDVVGFIRNLPDGRVELQCSGERVEVDAFLAAIIESELKSHIKARHSLAIPPLADARGFEIVP